MYSEVLDLESDFVTDHAVLVFNINNDPPHKKGLKRSVYNCKNANLSELSTSLYNAALEEIVNYSSNIDEAWSSWLTLSPPNAKTCQVAYNF